VIRSFLVWLQTQLGKGSDPNAQSWSEALLGSLNFWGLLEGTHLISLMLFAGTIFLVDLRLLGVIFRKTPVSVIDRKVLPLTIIGFAFMFVTGSWLFFAKPLVYYHNIWFRLKLVLILIALANIAYFHLSIQKSQHAWDDLEKPPRGPRIAAAVSLTAWIAVIFMGRFIAYNWFDCGKPQAAWINALQDCAKSEHGAVLPGQAATVDASASGGTHR
jgi:hypothetical protein